MLMHDDRPWPRKCSRCGCKIASMEHYHVNHGWDAFCDDCEKSFNKWMKRSIE
jgi:hypothetical protein